MDSDDRRIVESPIYQGVDEQIAYILTTTPWGTAVPTSPAVVMKDDSGLDVSSTNLSGSASINGNTVVTPTVKSLSAGAKYRLEIKFNISGNIFETWTDVYGQT